MFIGDSMITPAISVLSAVEGLKLATPALEHYVVPLTIFILVLLFSVQSGGTARVASAFGPVMVVWFATLAILGLVHISGDPTVLAAVNPWHAIQCLLSHGVILLVLLFRPSIGLAAAYGIAVSSAMVADGIMGFVVIWKLWNWRAATAAAAILPFVLVDMPFFSPNLLNLLDGAWVPLLFGAT